MREHRHLTQREVAKAAGVSQGFVNDLEMGRNVDFYRARKVVESLGGSIRVEHPPTPHAFPPTDEQDNRCLRVKLFGKECDRCPST